jgi:hypothetical protein
MKRLNFIFLFLSPVLIFAQGESLNEEWLNEDKTNFINLMDVLISDNKEINYFQDELKNIGVRAKQEIGFGAKKYEFAQSGGYISNWINICTLNDSIFYCKVAITSDDVEKMEILAERDSLISKLLRNWNRKSFKQNGGLFESFDYEYINNDLYQAFTDSVAKELGELNNTSIDYTVLNDYQTLTSPFENFDFGYACYIEGAPPIGRTAIENIKLSNPILVKRVIRGYCPEGRIYGVEALLELAEQEKLDLTYSDKKIIKKVLNLKIPINRCQGCMVSSVFAKDLFNEKELKELLVKNGIILE